MTRESSVLLTQFIKRNQISLTTFESFLRLGALLEIYYKNVLVLVGLIVSKVSTKNVFNLFR